MNARWILAALAPLFVACSSSSADVAPASGDGSLAAFSKYCTGTLKADHPLEAATNGGGWSTDGTTAAAGTSFLVAVSFDKWQGYVIRDGKPAKIGADLRTGLIKDTDFTSSCAVDSTILGKTVLLADATLYPNKDLTGTACVLPKATEFHEYTLTSGGDVTTLSAQEIKATCGVDRAYSADAHYASLVPR